MCFCLVYFVAFALSFVFCFCGFFFNYYYSLATISLSPFVAFCFVFTLNFRCLFCISPLRRYVRKRPRPSRPGAAPRGSPGSVRAPGTAPHAGTQRAPHPRRYRGGGVSEATTSAIITITIITIKCNGESRVRSVGVFGGAARNAVLLFGFFLVVVAAAVGLFFFFAVRKRGFVPEPSRGKKCLSPLGLLGPELRARQNRASAGGNFANPGVITAGPH